MYLGLSRICLRTDGMSNLEAKIRIKIGSIEVDYEGDPSFLKDGLNELIQSVSDIHSSLPQSSPSVPEAVVREPANPASSSIVPQPSLGLSTKSIAARMDAKSGPELAICAMAHLELVKGLDSYERKNILDEMKTATGYYNSNMSGNNAANIASLVKNKRVTEVGTGRFCLSATERKKVEAAIAEDG